MFYEPLPCNAKKHFVRSFGAAITLKLFRNRLPVHMKGGCRVYLPTLTIKLCRKNFNIWLY